MANCVLVPMNNALIKESSKMDQGSESRKMHIKLQCDPVSGRFVYSSKFSTKCQKQKCLHHLALGMTVGHVVLVATHGCGLNGPEGVHLLKSIA